MSIWQDFEAYEMLLWVAPIVFIMLGVELLLYLKFSGTDYAVIRYDWISVFFVGLIGMASLGLALLISTGLFDELERGLKMTQRSSFVDTTPIQVPANVEKMVVHALGSVELSEADTRELQLFGQIRYWSSEKLDPLGDSLVKTNLVGDTLYIMIGGIDRRDGGFVSDTIDAQLTLIVPKGVEVAWR
ncbi:hypothetical protein D3C78_1090200 [compost metagenome]